MPAALQLLQLGHILASRLFYPMDLEWMEGGVLLHAYRFNHGLDVYAAPDAGFMPFPYPPLHWFLLGVIGRVAGIDYVPGRLLSWAAMATSAALLAREIYRQFKLLPLPGAFALLALGMMAAGFPVTGGWYDIIRADSLAVALAVAAAVAVQPGTLTKRRFVVAAALLIAAPFAKQTNLMFVAWLLAYVGARAPKQGLMLAGIVLSVTAAVAAVLSLATHGYFWLYTVTQLSAHAVLVPRLLFGVWALLHFAPYLTVVPLAAIALARRGMLSPRSRLWCGMLAAALPAALLPYAKAGGFDNNFLGVVMLAPACASCLFGDALLRKSETTRAELRSGAKSACLVAAGACALYLVFCSYDESRYLVSADRHVAAERLNAYIRNLDGKVLIFHHPFLAVRNGKPGEQVHAMSYYDRVMAGHYDLTARAVLAREAPKYVLLTGEETPVFTSALAADYVFSRRLPVELARAETITPNTVHLALLLQRRAGASIPHVER